MAGPAGEGDDFPDVLHARGQQYEALKAQPKAGVGHAAIAAQVQITGVRLQRHPLLPQPRLQHLAIGKHFQLRGYQGGGFRGGSKHGSWSMPCSFNSASRTLGDREASRGQGMPARLEN